MNKSEIITQEILKIISNITKNNRSFKINENTRLIGDSSPIDSNDLVEICLAIEDLAIKDKFYFDWSSEKAMSDFNSIFKNAKTITEEYIRQCSNKE